MVSLACCLHSQKKKRPREKKSKKLSHSWGSPTEEMLSPNKECKGEELKV